MKRLWLVLFLLGLFSVFSTSALAVDVKLSGEYYAGGMYVDKVSLSKSSGSLSTAFYYQRLRMNADFIVSKGLYLELQWDMMKRAWGATRSNPLGGSQTVDGGGMELNNYTQAEGENIGINMMLLNWATPYGKLSVGMDAGSTFGTKFGNNGEEIGDGIIKWTGNIRSFIYTFKYYKTLENSLTAINATTATDRDQDKWLIGGGMPWKGGGFGFYANYSTNASGRASATNPRRSQVYSICGYIRHDFGVIYVETEGKHQFGYNAHWEAPSTREDIKRSTFAYYLNVRADLGMFYAGGIFAYSSGDDPATTRSEGDSGTGTDWNPNLILWNFERYSWQGGITGYDGAANNGPMKNALYGQISAGVKPISNLDIMAAVAYAHTDRKPADFVGGTYGWEVDLTATYKITNNLSYMLGAGYLFTGDYFKGKSSANQIYDDYIFINKLVLTL